MLDDVEDAVGERIVTISHVWPGITPFNIWDMEVDMWLRFATACDDYIRDMKEAERNNGSR